MVMNYWEHAAVEVNLHGLAVLQKSVYGLHDMQDSRLVSFQVQH